MTAACTILIPTHNRSRYLERCVRWFLDLPYPVVIADSSEMEWRSEFRADERIRYIHMPGGLEVYRSKLQKGVAAVETPYVAMCADDDFITAAGLAQSIGFLDSHPDYSFCQGYAYLFEVLDAHVVAWPLTYGGHEIACPEWIDRVERAKSTVYYGVHRTEVLRGAIDFLMRQDFSEILDAIPGFIDLCLTTNAARRGKLKRVNVPFGLREYSPYLQSAGTRPATIISRNVPDFYGSLLIWMMAGEDSEVVRNRLLRVFSRDYAGAVMFDLAGSRSKKRFVTWFGAALARRIEFLYRVYAAARIYASLAYAPAVMLFWHPEYRRLKQFVLPVEGR
ncbi:MAG: TIGR00180 family glycosyltransferase [Alphaproteobacteria bacterium]|nr:TIGR00180 family glycosyltransferase [Alphaproteobacteria bacterium]